MQTIAVSNAQAASEDTRQVPVFRPPSKTSAITRSAASSDFVQETPVAWLGEEFGQQDDLRNVLRGSYLVASDADGFQRKVWPERQFVGDSAGDRKQLRLGEARADRLSRALEGKSARHSKRLVECSG